MTTAPASVTRTIVLRRSARPGWWTPPYWTRLVGLEMRIPAGVVDGLVVEGYLVDADESGEDETVLTFADVSPQRPGAPGRTGTSNS